MWTLLGTGLGTAVSKTNSSQLPGIHSPEGRTSMTTHVMVGQHKVYEVAVLRINNINLPLIYILLSHFY